MPAANVSRGRRDVDDEVTVLVAVLAIRPVALAELPLAPAFRKVQYDVSCTKIKCIRIICSLYRK
jgi:hypothetical protein